MIFSEITKKSIFAPKIKIIKIAIFGLKLYIFFHVLDLSQMEQELTSLIHNNEDERMKKEEKRKSLLLKRSKLKEDKLEKSQQMENEFANLIHQQKRKNLLTKRLNLFVTKLEAKQQMEKELTGLLFQVIILEQ